MTRLKTAMSETLFNFIHIYAFGFAIDVILLATCY